MKVMISMPDELLAHVDGAARDRGLSRSAFLQEAARGRLAEPDAGVDEAIVWVRGRFDDVTAPPAADLIRRDRDRG
jgi:hypothetical protein